VHLPDVELTAREVGGVQHNIQLIPIVCQGFKLYLPPIIFRRLFYGRSLSSSWCKLRLYIPLSTLTPESQRTLKEKPERVGESTRRLRPTASRRLSGTRSWAPTIS
jgi:hypothetical protein